MARIALVALVAFALVGAAVAHKGEAGEAMKPMKLKHAGESVKVHGEAGHSKHVKGGEAEGEAGPKYWKLPSKKAIEKLAEKLAGYTHFQVRA